MESDSRRRRNGRGPRGSPCRTWPCGGRRWPGSWGSCGIKWMASPCRWARARHPSCPCGPGTAGAPREPAVPAWPGPVSGGGRLGQVLLPQERLGPEDRGRRQGQVRASAGGGCAGGRPPLPRRLRPHLPPRPQGAGGGGRAAGAGRPAVACASAEGGQPGAEDRRDPGPAGHGTARTQPRAPWEQPPALAGAPWCAHHAPPSLALLSSRAR